MKNLVGVFVILGIVGMIGMLGAATTNINVSTLNISQWNAIKSLSSFNTLKCGENATNIDFSYKNQSFDLKYNMSACPNPIRNITVNVASAYVNQTQKLFINNTNVDVNVEAVRQINKVINLTSPYSYYNNQEVNLTVRELLNKSVININSSFNPQNLSFKALNLSINVKPLSKINKHVILGFNQSYYNSSLNFTAVTPSITMFEQTPINYLDLYIWYNSTYLDNCASSIIIENGSYVSENVVNGNSVISANVPLQWHLCAQTKGQNQSNIGDICAGYDIYSKNFSPSIGQCVLGIHKMDLQNLSIVQNEYLADQNEINTQSRLIQNQTNIITQGTNLGAGLFQIVLVVVAGGVIGLGALIFLEIKKRNNVRIR